MMKCSLLVLPLAAMMLFAPEPCDAQIRGALQKARERVGDAKETISDARALRCDVEGACGEVTQSELFAAENYESLAVTVFDGTGRFSAAGTRGLVQDAFERRLVANGFLLAASADTDEVRERIARGEGGWSDEALKQLRDFIHGIDAVLVVEIRQLDIGECQPAGDRTRRNAEATVHLTARWLNSDAGDIPWVATHSATMCDGNVASVPTEVLQLAAGQLAGALPARN